MNAKERKVARERLLARLQPIDPALAEEVREMWAEEAAEKKRISGRASAKTQPRA
jgi:hypothetical protein